MCAYSEQMFQLKKNSFNAFNDILDIQNIVLLFFNCTKLVLSIIYLNLSLQVGFFRVFLYLKQVKTLYILINTFKPRARHAVLLWVQIM